MAPVTSISSGGQNREGWWRIDPRDGSTIGFGEDGRGNETVEIMVVFLSILYAGYHGLRCVEEGGSGVGCAVCFGLSAAVDILSACIAIEVHAAQAVGIGAAIGTAGGAAVGHWVCDIAAGAEGE